MSSNERNISSALWLFVLCLLIIIGFIFIIKSNNSTGIPPCEENQIGFKPHIVHHFHKSKKYKYYHVNSCQCNDTLFDLGLDKRNFIEYLP